jgi:hypothetical protein
MVVMPSLTAQFCMGVTEPDKPRLFPAPQALVCTVAHSNIELVSGENTTVEDVRFQLHTAHIDQVTTQLGLVPRQCSITFRIL